MLAAGTINALTPNPAVTVNGGTLDVTAYPQTVQSLTVSPLGTLNLSVSNLLTDPGGHFAGTLNVGNFSSGTAELIV